MFNTTTAVDYALFDHATKYQNDVTIPKLGFQSEHLEYYFLDI
jgi:hypothetical protein